MEKNKTGFFIIRGKINPERILLVKGKILSYRPYVDTTQYRVQILEFKHKRFYQFKRTFVGERFFTKSSERKMYDILRNSQNMDQIHENLNKKTIVANVDELYCFQSMKTLLKHLRPLQEFYVRKHLKDLYHILNSNYYEGPFKMSKNEFLKRFKLAFKDRYKKSFNDDTIDDFLKNL